MIAGEHLRKVSREAHAIGARGLSAGLCPKVVRQHWFDGVRSPKAEALARSSLPQRVCVTVKRSETSLPVLM
jgi:hypothetical protein